MQRARKAKDYFASRGISGDRINAVGFGESRPRYPCGEDNNCTEEEHQYNRRIEVKVTKYDESEIEKIIYIENPPVVIDTEHKPD